MSEQSNNDDRGALGRFAPGNKLGRGDPSGGRVERFRHQLLSATTSDDFLEVWAGIVRDAKAGNRYARREFLERVLGKAREHVELSPGANGDELRIEVVYVSRGATPVTARPDDLTVSQRPNGRAAT